MHKKLFLPTIALASFFLLFLGMRMPELGGNPRPKPRPRAVIETAAKACQETCKKQLADADLPSPAATRTPASCIVSRDHAPALPSAAAIVLALPARSPPHSRS